MWSSFNVAIRANSPVEGYHSRLKRMSKTPHLNLYLLFELLWTEADQVPCFLLANDKLGPFKKTYFTRNGMAGKTWAGTSETRNRNIYKNSLSWRVRCWRESLAVFSTDDHIKDLQSMRRWYVGGKFN